MLDGFRALDLTGPEGQLCGRILGDLGADVIKVEPPGGDPSRRIAPFLGGAPGPDRSLYWHAYNVNKRGVTLDITTHDGRALLRRLADTADLIVESHPPGYLDGLGFDLEALRAARPSLVITSITPFGQTGPDSGRAAGDLLLMARGGLLNICGEDDGPPSRVRVSQSYCQAGAQAAVASIVALYAAERSGHGERIDVSMQEAVANSLISVQQHWDLLRVNERRGTTQLRGGKVLGRYSWPAKDGSVAWCWWVAPGWGFKMYPLMEWMTEEGMAGDLWDWDWENRSTNELEQDEVDHWEDIFGAFFKDPTTAEIYTEALKRRIMLFPTYTMEDLADYRQLAEREYFVDVDLPGAEAPVRFPGPWVAASGGEWALRRPAPAIGEHNREVYGGELDLTQDDLAALHAAGAI